MLKASKSLNDGKYKKQFKRETGWRVSKEK